MPDPDGFTAEFLRACWGTIKGDICAAFDGLQKLNQALITLLPKKADASSFFDYRPISLIHIFAKLFAKVLSLRLALKMASLVSTNQSTFIARRGVHDNFLLVQQTARLLHNLKAPRVLLKLDIACAFDTVSWPFLLETLSHLGSGRRWCAWVCMLLSAASTRVLVNALQGPQSNMSKACVKATPFPLCYSPSSSTLLTLYSSTLSATAS